jgi:hypothetical protein
MNIQPQLTGNEQLQVIRAALQVLDPTIFELRPHPGDTWTIAQHFEEAILQATDASNGVRTIPELFHDMSAAALSKVDEVIAGRANGIPL